MWFFWIFSESLMSRLPALTDPDFIRLSFAHFEERCHMGGLFFFELSQVLLADGAGSARKTEHQATPIPAPGGSPGAQQEPGSSTESPSKGLLDGKHNSGIQQLLWAPGSFTKAALNWIASELFPVSWEWRALSCINVIPYSSFQEPCWPAFLYCIPSNREDPDPFETWAVHRITGSDLYPYLFRSWMQADRGNAYLFQEHSWSSQTSVPALCAAWLIGLFPLFIILMEFWVSKFRVNFIHYQSSCFQ